MSKFAIIADITCDLGEQFQKEYDINVVPGHVVIPGKGDIQSFLKWEIISREEFYSALKKDPASFATSPPNTTEFALVMEKFAAENTDMLVMTISGGMSGTFGFACKAAEEVTAKYPNIKIRCIDTLRFGPGFGLMAIHASMLRESGLSLDEVADKIEADKNRYHQAGWLDDLSFVAKKGRLTHSKAFFGTLVGVKPIGEFDYTGMTTVIGKAKGTRSAFSALIDYISETIEDPSEQIIFIAQTNRLPQAQEYKRLIEEKFKPKAVYINDVFPACGVNIGPGLMAAYYVGKPISSDLSVEKAIIEKSIAKGE